MGISAENILNGDAPPQLVRQLLEARLRAELSGRSTHAIAESQVARDWELLQKTMGIPDSGMATRNVQPAYTLRGNHQ